MAGLCAAFILWLFLYWFFLLSSGFCSTLCIIDYLKIVRPGVIEEVCPDGLQPWVKDINFWLHLVPFFRNTFNSAYTCVLFLYGADQGLWNMLVSAEPFLRGDTLPWSLHSGIVMCEDVGFLYIICELGYILAIRELFLLSDICNTGSAKSDWCRIYEVASYKDAARQNVVRVMVHEFLRAL